MGLTGFQAAIVSLGTAGFYVQNDTVLDVNSCFTVALLVKHVLPVSTPVGMAIQTIVFFICFLFLVFLIIVPVFYHRNLIVFEIVERSW